VSKHLVRMRGLIVTITRGDLFPYVEHSTVIKIARGQNRKHRAGPDGQVGLTACTVAPPAS